MQNGSKWPAQPIVSNSTSTRNKTWIHYLVFRGFISWIVLRSRFVVNVRRDANCFAIGTAIFLTHSQLNSFTFTFACVRIRKCNCKHINVYMYLNLDTNAGKQKHSPCQFGCNFHSRQTRIYSQCLTKMCCLQLWSLWKYEKDVGSIVKATSWPQFCACKKLMIGGAHPKSSVLHHCARVCLKLKPSKKQSFLIFL